MLVSYQDVNLFTGMGIVLVAIVSAVMYKQIPDLPAIIGVIIINIFSKSLTH